VGWMRASNAISTRQKWADLVRQHEQSGAAVKDFCHDRGVSEPSFYSWRKRLRTSEPVRFALVDAGTPVANVRATSSVELILVSGDRLRIPAGADAATLRTVLSVLRERA
jgi:transposase-like protein